MRVLIEFIDHPEAPEWARHLSKHLNQRLDHIMATQSELAQQIAAITAQVAKIGTETSATLQKVIDLQAIIDAGEAVSPELQAAVDALKVQAQKTDDLVPDATGAGAAGA